MIVDVETIVLTGNFLKVVKQDRYLKNLHGTYDLCIKVTLLRMLVTAQTINSWHIYQPFY